MQLACKRAMICWRRRGAEPAKALQEHRVLALRRSIIQNKRCVQKGNSVLFKPKKQFAGGSRVKGARLTTACVHPSAEMSLQILTNIWWLVRTTKLI